MTLSQSFGPDGDNIVWLTALFGRERRFAASKVLFDIVDCKGTLACEV